MHGSWCGIEGSRIGSLCALKRQTQVHAFKLFLLLSELLQQKFLHSSCASFADPVVLCRGSMPVLPLLLLAPSFPARVPHQNVSQPPCHVALFCSYTQGHFRDRLSRVSATRSGTSVALKTLKLVGIVDVLCLSRVVDRHDDFPGQFSSGSERPTSILATWKQGRL